MKNEMRQYIAALAIVLVGMVGSVYADVTGPEWGQEGGSWYIIKITANSSHTISSRDESSPNSVTVYVPNANVNCTCYFQMSSTYWLSSNYLKGYYKCGANQITVGGTNTSSLQNGTLSLPSHSTSISYWYSWTTSWNAPSAYYGFEAELPKHYELLSTADETFGYNETEVFSTNVYNEFNFDSYFNSYYTEGAITIEIADAPNHTGESAMFHIGSASGGQGLTSVIPKDVVYAAANTCCTAGIVRSDGVSSKKKIYYVPTNIGNHEAYLNIYYNGGQNPIKRIKLTGKGTYPTLDFGNVYQCFTKEKTVTGLTAGSVATVSKRAYSGTKDDYKGKSYYIDYFVSADGTTWSHTATVGSSGILYVKYQPSDLCKLHYGTSSDSYYNSGTITIKLNGTTTKTYNVTGNNKGTYIVRNNTLTKVLEQHTYGPTNDWFSFTKTINTGTSCNTSSLGNFATDGLAINYPCSVQVHYAGDGYTEGDFMFCDYATPDEYISRANDQWGQVSATVPKTSGGVTYQEAGFRIAHCPLKANNNKTSGSDGYHAQCEVRIKCNISGYDNRLYYFKYRIVNGEEEQTVDGFDSEEGQGIAIGNSSGYQAFDLNGFRGFGSTENGTATVGCSSSSCDGEDDVLFCATSNGTWSKTLTIQNGVGNIYIKYAPQTEQTSQRDKTIYVKDNTHTSRIYQFKVHLGTAHYKEIIFNEATAVGSISSEIQRCELSNFSPSGNLNVQVINPNGTTNFIVCEASSGTYDESCVITSAQSAKEFYVKFAPQVSGTLYNETIRVTDVATSRTYDILVSRAKPKATIQFNYSLTNMAQSSTARNINLADYVALIGSDESVIPVTSWTFATSGTCTGFTLSGSNLIIAANATGSGKISITANGVSGYDITTNPILVDVNISASTAPTTCWLYSEPQSSSSRLYTFDNSYSNLPETWTLSPSITNTDYADYMQVVVQDRYENCRFKIMDGSNPSREIYSVEYEYDDDNGTRTHPTINVSLDGYNLSAIKFVVEGTVHTTSWSSHQSNLSEYPLWIQSVKVTKKSMIKLVNPSNGDVNFNTVQNSIPPYNSLQQNITVEYCACGKIETSISGTDASSFSVQSTIATSSDCSVGNVQIPIFFTPTTGKGKHTATLTLTPDNGNPITINLTGYSKKRDQIVSFTSPTQISYVYSPSGHTINLAAKTNVAPFTGETGLSTYTYSIESELPDDDVASLIGSTLTLGSTGTVCVKAYNAGTDYTNAAYGLIYITVTKATPTITWDDDKKNQTITTCSGSTVALGATSSGSITYDLTLDADASTCVTSISDLVDSQTGGTITLKSNYKAAKINVAASIPESRNYAAAGPVDGTVTITPCDDYAVTWTQDLTDAHYGDQITLEEATSGYNPGGEAITYSTTNTADVSISGDKLNINYISSDGATVPIKANQAANSCYNTAKSSNDNNAKIYKTDQKVYFEPGCTTKTIHLPAIAANGTYQYDLSTLASPYAVDKRHSTTTGCESVETHLTLTTDGEKRSGADIVLPTAISYVSETLLTGHSSDHIAIIDNGKLKVTGYGTGTIKLLYSAAAVDNYYKAVSDDADKAELTVVIDKVDAKVEFTLDRDNLDICFGDKVSVTSAHVYFKETTIEIKKEDKTPFYTAQNLSFSFTNCNKSSSGNDFEINQAGYKPTITGYITGNAVINAASSTHTLQTSGKTPLIVVNKITSQDKVYYDDQSFDLWRHVYLVDRRHSTTAAGGDNVTPYWGGLRGAGNVANDECNLYKQYKLGSDILYAVTDQDKNDGCTADIYSSIDMSGDGGDNWDTKKANLLLSGQSTGEVEIGLSISGNASLKYYIADGQTTTFAVDVLKRDPELRFTTVPTSPLVTTQTYPFKAESTYSTKSTGVVTYSIPSEYSGVATIDASTGVLTPITSGTIKVVATIAATCLFEGKSIESAEFTIEKADRAINWTTTSPIEITTCTGAPVTLDATATGDKPVNYSMAVTSTTSCATELSDVVASVTDESDGTKKVNFVADYPAAEITVTASVATSDKYKDVEPVSKIIKIERCSTQKVIWTQNITVIDNKKDMGFKYGDRLALTAPTWTYPSSTAGGYHFTTVNNQIVNVTKDSIYALYAGTTSVTAWQDATTCYNTEKGSSPNNVTVALTQEAMAWRQPNKKLERNAIGQSQTAIGSNDLKSPYVINARHSETKSGRTTYLSKNTYKEVVVTELNDPTQYQYRTVVVNSSDTSLLPSKSDSCIVKFKDNKVIVTGYGSGKVKLAVTEKNGVAGKYCPVPDPASGSLFHKYEDSIDIVVKKITPSGFKLYYSGMPSDGLHYGDYITIDSIHAMLNDTTEIKDYLGKSIYSWAESRNSYTTSYTSYPVTGGYGIYIAPRSSCAISSKGTKEKIRMNVGNNAKPKVRIGIGTADAVSNAKYYEPTIDDKTVANTPQEIVCSQKTCTISVDTRTTPSTLTLSSYVYGVDTRHSYGRSYYDSINTYLSKSQKIITGNGTTIPNETIQAVLTNNLLRFEIVSQTPETGTTCTNDLVDAFYYDTTYKSGTTTISGIVPKMKYYGHAGIVCLRAINTAKTNTGGTSYYELDTLLIYLKFTRHGTSVKLYQNDSLRNLASSDKRDTSFISYGDVYVLRGYSYYGSKYSSDKDTNVVFTYTIKKGTSRIDSDSIFKATAVNTVRLRVEHNATCHTKTGANEYYYFSIGKANRTVAWGPNTDSLTSIYTNDTLTLDAFTRFTNNKGTTKTIGKNDRGTLAYTIVTGSDYVELVDDTILRPKKNITVSPGTEIAIAVAFTNAINFEDAYDTLRFTLEPKQIEWLNVAKYNMSKSNRLKLTGLTSTTVGFDLIPELKRQKDIKTNYPDGTVKYTFAVTGTNFADEVPKGSNKLTGYMRTYSSADFYIIITAKENITNSEATDTFYIDIDYGDLRFIKAGKWIDTTNWSRPDIAYKQIDLKNKKVNFENFDVIICDSSFIGIGADTCYSASEWSAHTINASCHKLTIPKDSAKAKVVIGEASTLYVKDELSNSVASKLVLTANKWGQATVVFRNSSTEAKPKATIEMFVPAGNGSRTAPVWQYRGIAVDSTDFVATAGPWNSMTIYWWREADNGNLEHGCWNPVANCTSDTNSIKLKPWVGYAFANMTTDSVWLRYTGTLINSTKEFGLTRTDDKKRQDGSLYENCGINLITNSFAAPMTITKAIFDTAKTNATVTFFNAGTYYDWEKHQNDSTTWGRGKAAGQRSVCPQNTAGTAHNTFTIPSGQSFFVTATQNGGKVTFSYDSVRAYIAPSGQMYIPAMDDEPEFNVLGIRVKGKEKGDRLVLLECDSCSRQYDNGYDGYEMRGEADGWPHIYAYNKFGNTAVNADSTFNKQYVGFAAGSDDETYTISFETDRLFGYHSLYLVDRKMNETVDILAGETYSFKGYTVGENTRFQINGVTIEEWEKENEGGDDDVDDGCDLRVVGNTLFVEGFTAERYGAARIEVFDMTGNMVWGMELGDSRVYELPVLPQGVYMVRLGDCVVKYVVR